MDDGDSKNKIFKTIKKEANRAIQKLIIDVSYVLPAAWLRCPIQADYGPDWIILGRGRRILFYFRLFLVVLYIVIEIFKNQI
jgi:hypothetical protein